jgi:hypothetical protein
MSPLNLAQRLRHWLRRLSHRAIVPKLALPRVFGRGGSRASAAGLTIPRGAGASPLIGRLWRWIVLGLILAPALYFGLGSTLDHEIRDTLELSSPPVSAGQSVMVDRMAYMIEREVDDVGWVANTPPIAPNALLKFGGNMMNFQMGILAACGVVTVELRDQVGRGRGGSAADEDLLKAASGLQYDPERWVFGWGRVLPSDAAEDQYRDAARALRRYNTRLGASEATFEARTDNLLALMNRIALDLGAASAQLDDQIANGRKGQLIDRRADKLFYNVKGRTYAYVLILEGAETDFADVIAAREIGSLYAEMLISLRKVANAQPLMVLNGKPSGILANNHLTGQGFHVLRGRTRLREMTDILAK